MRLFFLTLAAVPPAVFFASTALAQTPPADASGAGAGAGSPSTEPSAPTSPGAAPDAATPPLGGPPAPGPAQPASAAGDAVGDDTSALGKDGHPMSGWHNGLFYLRDYHDDFRLYVQGRAQIDFYGYLGPGVSDTPLKPTLFLRRIRPEISGEILHNWQFMIAGDFGATSIDNPRGTAETSAAPPGATPTAGSARYGGAQTVHIGAQATDVFVNYRAHDLFRVMVGQYDAPFTMENQTSDKYFPFIERSLAVRVVGVPTNKEIGAMAWGETPDKLWAYEIGIFDGDGQNRVNTDSRGDAMMRTWFHPLASRTDELKNLQVGASLRYGSRDKHYTDYDFVTMTTQAGYGFWTPVYVGANGPTHVLPSGQQVAAAGELRVPFRDFDLTSELVYLHDDTREALEGFQATNTERLGTMKGYSYYVMLGWWPFGGRDVNGLPGYSTRPPHVDFSKPDKAEPTTALQLLLKWEQLALNYQSAARDGVADAKNIDGDIKVNALSLGANYWATKHVRVGLDYVLDMFPDSAPSTASAPGGPTSSATNRAQAPGNTLGKGVNDDARDNAHTLHEVIARFAVAL